ncbi:MAG: leucine-rich repeat protein [Clostridiales bacterium]|nr:leucine-rich repeat protein [Clostridiales bacterium]
MPFSASPTYYLKNLKLNEGLISIGEEAFTGPSIQQIDLPASLTQIEDNVFSFMAELKSIHLTDGNPAFMLKDNALLSADGKRLMVLPLYAGNTSFEVPAGVERIDNTAFYKNPTLQSVTLPEGLTTIGNHSFSGLANLSQDIILPSTLKEIGDAAFYRYTGTSITLPEGLQVIGDHAFSESKLHEISVPDTVTSLGAFAFSESADLQKAKLSGNVESLRWGLFQECAALKEVIVPAGVQSFNSNVFGGCKDVVIHVPDSLVTIDPEAFEDLWAETPADLSTFTLAGAEDSPAKDIAQQFGLQYVVDTSLRYVPKKADGIYTSQDDMFEYLLEGGQITIHNISNFSGKKKVEVPTEIEGYPVVALGIAQSADDDWVKSIMASNDECRELILQEGIERINYAALAHAPVEKITLPDSLKSISGFAFLYSKIKSLALPSGLETLEAGALSGMSKLSKLTIKGYEKAADILKKDPTALDNLRFIALDGLLYEFDRANGGSAVVACLPSKSGVVKVSPGTTKIAPSAFASCEKITQVVLPEEVTEIGESAFAWCFKLSKINLPANIKSLPERAFHMTGLTEIKLPEGLTDLGTDAFYNASKLKSILLPASLVSIGETAFRGNGLTAFELAEGNQHFSVVDGVLFSQDMTTLVEYPGGSKAKEYTVPDSVVTLSPGVFSECKNLNKITLPEGITRIPYRAFSGNGKTKLTIVFPSTLTEIGDAAFNGVNFGNDLVLPEGIISIGEMAFDQAIFKTLVLPEGLTHISRWSFRWNPALTTITIPSTLTSIPEGAFEGNRKLTEIIGVEHLQQVDENAFSDCPKLKTSLPGR